MPVSPPDSTTTHYDDDNDEYQVPLRDQRYFGSGLKRKRVKFVPAMPTPPNPASAMTAHKSAQDLYLSIVLKDRPATAIEPSDKADQGTPLAAGLRTPTSSAVPTAEPKQLEFVSGMADSSNTRRWTPSIAQQLSVPHVHPPSALDRRHIGLSILGAQGWDPDARRGLGLEGSEGRLYPVRAVEKNDKAGLGYAPEAAGSVAKGLKRPIQATESRRLDAGQVRALEKEDKRKADRLRRAFFQEDDVEKYLQPSDEWE